MLLLSHSHINLNVQPCQIEIRNKTTRFVEVNSHGKVWSMWCGSKRTTQNYCRR